MSAGLPDLYIFLPNDQPDPKRRVAETLACRGYERPFTARPDLYYLWEGRRAWFEAAAACRNVVMALSRN